MPLQIQLPILDPSATATEIQAALPTIEAAELLIPGPAGQVLIKAEDLLAAAITNPTLGPWLIGLYNDAARHFNAMVGTKSA